MTRRRADDGFSLIEVLVALAIVSLGLVTFYSALGGYFRDTATLGVREVALAEAQSHLETMANSADPLPPSSTGRYRSGATWRLTTQPIVVGDGSATLPAQPFTVVLDVFSPDGRRLQRLKSVQLTRAPQQ